MFYKWRRRYEDVGEAALRDGSSVPLHSPNATKADVVGKIIYLRQHYHFGPLKISMYVKRYHDVDIGHSGVYPVLKRLDLNRLPASQRYKRHTDRWKRCETAPGPSCAGPETRADLYTNPLRWSHASSKRRCSKHTLPHRRHHIGLFVAMDVVYPQNPQTRRRRAQLERVFVRR